MSALLAKAPNGFYITAMQTRFEARRRGWREGLSLQTIMRKLGEAEHHAFLLHADDRVTHYWTTPDGRAHTLTFPAGSPDARWHWRQAQGFRDVMPVG